jgi:hypothetical protein
MAYSTTAVTDVHNIPLLTPDSEDHLQLNRSPMKFIQVLLRVLPLQPITQSVYVGHCFE